MNTKCFFGFHKWILHPYWGEIKNDVWVDMPKTFKPNGEEIFITYRVCSCCGKRQW